MATKRDDGFDEWDPKNISQLVTFLAPTRRRREWPVFIVFAATSGRPRLPTGRRSAPRHAGPPRADRGQGDLFKGSARASRSSASSREPHHSVAAGASRRVSAPRHSDAVGGCGRGGVMQEPVVAAWEKRVVPHARWLAHLHHRHRPGRVGRRAGPRAARLSHLVVRLPLRHRLAGCKRRVLALDMLGYGLSDKPDVAYTMALQATSSPPSWQTPASSGWRCSP